MTKDIQTVGIMFDSPNGERDDFPTVRAVAECHTSYLNLYSLGDLVDTFGDWLVIAHDPRCLMYGDSDNEAVDETNYLAILAELSAAPVSLHDIRHADHTYRPHADQIAEALEIGVAVVQHCLIIAPRVADFDPDSAWVWNEETATHDWREGDTDNIDAMVDLRARLVNYPLLDEEAFSEREFDAWQEFAPMGFSDEVSDARRERADYASESALDNIDEHAEELLPILAQQLHYYYGFSGDYGPKFLTILADMIRADTDDQTADTARARALLSTATKYWLRRAFPA